MARIRDYYTIDFESFKIEPRPTYPPTPVSLSIKRKGKKARFYSWGHVSGGNNSTFKEAKAALKKVWDSGLPILGQNLKFDIAVANEKMGLPVPHWSRMHDTMFLLFLHDPYAPSFSLKPSAERLLGMAPDERDAIKEWLVENKKMLRQEHGVVITDSDKSAAMHIAYAPGNVVEPYCNGDVIRTEKLFELLYDDIVERGMLKAYDTERELMPILLANEREGLRVNAKKLREDTAMYEGIMLRCDKWLRARLDADEDLNIDSDAKLAEALDAAGVVAEWSYTKPSKRFPQGQKSMAKDNLTLAMFSDEKVYRVLTYRNKLAYSLATFMRPWLATATATKGTIHTDWRQVPRQGAGAVTGRLSSSPNFQNITKNIEEKANAYQHPRFLKWAPELPSLRLYILPDKGHLIGRRDFSQQELRILAEFEMGALFELYTSKKPPKHTLDKDGKVDVHLMAMHLLNEEGIDIDRGDTKGFNFGILYGMGATGLAARLGITIPKAKLFIATWNRVMPDVANLVTEIKEEVRKGGVICTWGGRQYGMPPPVMFGDRERNRDYVLLNYLIQGSGADATKRAMIEFHKRKTKSCRMLASVHDEVLFSCPAEDMPENQRILAECISGLKFEVGMSSDGKAGKNWGSAVAWEDAA